MSADTAFSGPGGTMRRFSSALLITASASLLLGLAVVPAGAGTFELFSLSGSPTQVKTSTGKTLNLSLFATRVSGDSSFSVSVTLQKGTYNKGETHVWSFRVDSGTFDYNNGQGTLDTGNLPMALGNIDLTFTKASQSTSNCPDSGTTTNIRGSLHGMLHFNSKSNSWGNVNDNHFAFDSPNVFTDSNNCTGESGSPRVICAKSINWTAPYQPGSAGASGFTLGSGSNADTTITGSRIVLLDNVGNVTRSDTVADEARTPLIDGGKLKIRTKRGSHVRGSATMSGGDTFRDSKKCHKGKRTFTEHATSHTGTTWHSPDGLKFKEDAFPNFSSVMSGTNSGWTVATYR